MAHIDPTALEAIIKESGVGARTAKKLREANSSTAAPAAEKKPRGHGAPRQNLPSIDEL